MKNQEACLYEAENSSGMGKGGLDHYLGVEPDFGTRLSLDRSAVRDFEKTVVQE